MHSRNSGNLLSAREIKLNRTRAITLLAILVGMLLTVVPARAEDDHKLPEGRYQMPELYVAGESFAETLQKTRELYREARPEIPADPHQGPWYKWKDVEAEEFETAFPPEELNAESIHLEEIEDWSRKPSWAARAENFPEQKRDTMTYVARVIECKDPVAVAIEIGVAPRGSVFLNGKQLMQFKSRSMKVKHHPLLLNLPAGRNLLIIKIHNTSWRSLFYYRMHWTSPADTVLGKLRLDYPKLTAELEEQLDAADMTVDDWFMDDKTIATHKLAAAGDLGETLGVDPAGYIREDNALADLATMLSGARALSMLGEIPWNQYDLATARLDDVPDAELAARFRSDVDALREHTEADARHAREQVAARQWVGKDAIETRLAQAKELTGRAGVLRSMALAASYDGPDLLGNQWAHAPSGNPVLTAKGLPAELSEETLPWEAQLGRQQ